MLSAGGRSSLGKGRRADQFAPYASAEGITAEAGGCALEARERIKQIIRDYG